MKTTKKIILTGISCCLYVSGLFAGGILTNTNQSVHFLRNPARGASTEIDAVYTNPAGLAKLSEDGLHFSLNNQSAFQTRTITSTFDPFKGFGGNATKEFKGEASALFIPSLLAAYKTGNWVFSGSFTIAGGGGSLVFDKGLPMFESRVAVLPPMLSEKGIPTSQYSLESRLEGTSITYGVQLGATYKINDMFSAFAGARANFVGNGYEGYIRNIQANIGGGPMTNVNQYFTGAAALAKGAAGSLQPIIDGGAGGLTLNEFMAINPMFTQENVNQLAAALGQSPDVVGNLPVSYVQGALNTLATEAEDVAALTADKAINLTQSGWGITPIIGFNFSYQKLNVGVKYEFITKLNIENKTEVNTSGEDAFDDKVKTPYDLPALLTIGAQYDVLPSVTVSAGYHHFFDSDAKMGKVKDFHTGEMVEKQKYINGGINEYLFGAEWRINKMFLVSGGIQFTRTGVTDNYQTDLSYSLNSYAVSLGGAVDVTKSIRINLGYLFTNYEDWTKKTEPITFARTNKAFGIGVDFRF